MDNSIPVWLLPLLSFAVGVIATLLISRMMRSEPDNTPDHRINELQQRFDSYQDEVVAHFSTTAELVNKLTENYQNVQEHLLQSAERLALDEDTRQRLLNSLVDTRALEQPEPPAAEPAQEAPAAPASETMAVAEPEAVAEDTKEAAETEVIAEPPRDYACKAEGEIGTLDASYGLKKD